VAQTLSVNIDSPVAEALVGPVVHVSGTVSVVSSGPPFGHQVDRVTVQVGTGSQVTAQVTGLDLLTAANLCGTTSADTAFGRWRAHKTLIDGELATIVDAFDSVVQGQLSGPDLDFTTLSKNDAAGEDISSDLAAPGLTVPAFRFLASVRAVHPTSTPLAGERRDVASVVVQDRKIVVRYATWRAEERGAVRGRSGRHPVRPGAAARRSFRLGRLATYFGRSGPAGRSPVRKRHARLPSMSIWLMCGCLKAAAGPPRPRRERDGTQNSTGAAASDKGRDGFVRCAEAGQDSLGTNGRSTRLRSQI
jgi:hypothetical protein